MNKLSVFAVTLMMAAVLTGCADTTKQDIGTVTGGVIGGLVGSRFGGGSGQVVAAVAGTVVGAVIGGAIGKSMDKTDKLAAQKTLESTPTGQSATWKNPDTGNSYTMTPTKTYQAHGTYCRDYVTNAWIDGQQQQVHGTACRKADGSWHNVN
ncbi:MAG: RT0821/Lpp0805 family surface protein [Gammaproteobacteria bacterium]